MAGKVIPLNDAPEILDFFKAAWQQQNADVIVYYVLANESFWGQDFNKVKGLAGVVAKALD